MSEHTPGPWEIREDGHVWHASHPCLLEGRICLLTDPQHPTAKADGRLIAAAPELLEALNTAERRLSKMAGDMHPPDVAALQVIRAAIAKAEEGTP